MIKPVLFSQQQQVQKPHWLGHILSENQSKISGISSYDFRYDWFLGLSFPVLVDGSAAHN